LPRAEFIGNLVSFPNQGAKEWPDLSDWNLPERFITSPLVVTGANKWGQMII
tara:strand:+ start:5074 stop:5229 length:156 start_codon:yes stop_codon:yes gene_type:complete